MITFENKADIVYLEDDKNRSDKKFVILNKDITIKKNQFFELNTGLFISCKNIEDICFITGELWYQDSKLNPIYTERFYIEYPEENIEFRIKIINNKDSDLLIPKDTQVCEIISAYSANNIMDIESAISLNVYKDDKVVVKALDNLQRAYEITDLNNGYKELKVFLY